MLQRGGELEHAGERGGVPWARVRDRRQRARRRASRSPRPAPRRSSRTHPVLDRGNLQAVVPSPRFPMRQRARLAHPRDDAAGGQGDGVLVERLAVRCGHARGVQRQRAAEGAAQIVALGQLARVGREQLASAGKQRHLERIGPRHRPNLPGQSCARWHGEPEGVGYGHELGLLDRARLPARARLDARVRARGDLAAGGDLARARTRAACDRALAPLQEQVKERGLWATHLPPSSAARAWARCASA